MPAIDLGVTGLTVTEVRGYGRQQGKTEVYRGTEYEVRLLPKVKVEIACSDESVDKIDLDIVLFGPALGGAMRR